MPDINAIAMPGRGRGGWRADGLRAGDSIEKEARRVALACGVRVVATLGALGEHERTPRATLEAVRRRGEPFSTRVAGTFLEAMLVVCR